MLWTMLLGLGTRHERTPAGLRRTQERVTGESLVADQVLGAVDTRLHTARAPGVRRPARGCHRRGGAPARRGSTIPPPRSPSAELKRVSQVGSQRRACRCVRRRRPRVRIKRPVHDLGDLVRRRAEHVLVGCSHIRERFAPGGGHVELPVPLCHPTPTRGSRGRGPRP